MSDGGDVPSAFSVRILWALAVAVPFLVAIALILYLIEDEQDLDPLETSPPVAVAAKSSPELTPVDAIIAGAGREAVGENLIVQVRGGQRVELLDARGGDVVARIGDETEFGSPSVLSVLRISGQWLGITSALLPNGEVGWIRADPRELTGGYVDNSIVVDLSERSAKLYEGETRIRSWPITVGAPGTETPIGTFAVTDTFRGGLSPAYGCCAVAISATQPNLPSGWLGGNLIAFHGTDTELGQAASGGCLRSSNEDVSALVNTAPLGTPVKIRE